MSLGVDVPCKGDEVLDDFRLRAVLPTVQYLRREGARTLIFGKRGSKKEETLSPVYHYFLKQFPLTFVDSIDDQKTADALSHLEDGEMVLFENIRQYDGEITNDKEFAKKLARLADIYVNECFPVSHREEASIVGVPQFLPSYAGIRFMEEVRSLSRAFEPLHPFLFILGGAKFETKIPLLKKFFKLADHVFVGGALQNDFFRLKGYEIGRSVVSEKTIDLGDMLHDPKLLLPIDVEIEHEDKTTAVVKPMHVAKEDRIVDAGPASIKMLKKYIDKSKFIIWNGPLGYYEDGFEAQTKAFAELVNTSSAEVIIGGGDTLAAIAALGLGSRNSKLFLSTGGGAMLDFLARETLPGIEALVERYHYS
ncbi:MAG: Phosphoglycerate kinase [Parcubacteria group bacterium Gr01-1014_48]|nr:MAG: Phosphoglycerate kinase [Parcubacteria group bacterium Gr01-1014_48]